MTREDEGAIRRLGRGLVEACGFDGYREANLLRIDDQKVRTLAGDLLARARQAVTATEGEFRRTHLPAPTRAQPVPPADAVAQARRIEALARQIGGVEGQVRHAAVPGNDRTTQRFRAEGETLEKLIDTDRLLVGHAEALRAAVADQPPDALLAALPAVEQHLAALTRALEDRRLLTL